MTGSTEKLSAYHLTVQRGLCTSCRKFFPPSGKNQCVRCRKRWAERAKQKRNALREVRRRNGIPHNVRPRKGTTIKCAQCGRDVYITACHSRRRYCSMKCSALGQLTNRPIVCVICHGAFYVSKSQQRLRNRECCSKTCRFKLKRQRVEQRRIEEGYTKHQLDRLARYSPEAAAWRKSVFERDDYTCQVCRVRGGKLEADHIKPFAYFPELRHELSNGRTLCRICHDKTKMSAKKMREVYGIAA